jgi:hypothetical protein
MTRNGSRFRSLTSLEQTTEGLVDRLPDFYAAMA